MTDCPICDYPMVWSDDNKRVWCSVYGDHRSPIKQANTNVMRSHPTPVLERPRPTRLSYD